LVSGISQKLQIFFFDDAAETNRRQTKSTNKKKKANNKTKKDLILITLESSKDQHTIHDTLDDDIFRLPTAKLV